MNPFNIPTYPDQSDYSTNAPSYYEDLARKGELIKFLANRIWEYDKELAIRFAAWDKNLEEFDEEVIKLLQQWITDGTFADIINGEIFDDLNKKIENVAIDITSFPYNAVRGTDITPILTAVIDMIHAVGGGTVKIPAGVYIVNGSVDLPSNIKLVGDPGGTILKKTNAATEGYMFTVGRTTKFGATSGYGGGGKNISFEGIEFHGHAPTKFEYKALALSFHHAQNLNFDNCRFYNCMTRDHAIDLAGCSDVLVTNCSFEGSFNFEGREYNECIQIDSSAPTALPQFHSYDALPTKNVTIRECQFIPSYTPDGQIFNYAPHPVGNHGHTGGKPYENIVFENNLVKDGQPKWNGGGWRGWIHFYGVKNLIIRNNRFLNTKSIKTAVISILTSSGGRYDPVTLEAGVGVPTISSDIEVSGNTFEGFNNMEEANDLIRMYGTEYVGTGYPVKKISINENRFIDCAASGLAADLGQTCIHVSNFEWIQVANNMADKVNRMVSIWDGEQANVSNNNAQNCANSFLFHSAVKHTAITGNVVNTSRMPLEIQEVDNVIIMGNVFTDCRQLSAIRYAVKLRNLKNASIIGNVVQTNEATMDYGYYVYDLIAEGSLSDVNNLDNMAIGFLIRPYNTSGVMTRYVAR